MTQQLHRTEPMNRRRWALPAALVIGATLGMAAAVAVTDAMAHDGGAPPPAETRPEPRVTSSSSVPPSSTAPPDGVVTPPSPAPRPAYLIIQDEIDRALAEREQRTRGG